MWEQTGNTEEETNYNSPTPPHPPKGKNRAHNEFMLSLPIGCMKFLFPKLFITILGLG